MSEKNSKALEVLTINPQLVEYLQTTCRASELKCYAYANRNDTIKILKAKKVPNEEITGKIQSALRLIYEMVGLKPNNYPTPGYSKVLVEYINKRFQDLTVDELFYAFEFAIAEVFEADLEHYQSFDLPYFSKIIRAYGRYKNGTIDKIKKVSLEYTEFNDLIRKRPINDRCIKNEIVRSYRLYFEGQAEKIFPMGSYYECLNELGLIETPAKEKNKYLKEARQKVESRGYAVRSKDTKHIEEFKLRTDRDVELIAKHSCIMDLFSDLKEFCFWPSMLSSTLDRVCFIRHSDHEQLYLFQKKYVKIQQKAD